MFEPVVARRCAALAVRVHFRRLLPVLTLPLALLTPAAEPPALPIETVMQTRRQAKTVAFSPDGKYLFTAGHKGATLWDRSTGRELRTFAIGFSDTIGSADFSSDSERLVTLHSFSDTISIWRCSDAKKLRTLGPVKMAVELEFSPDDRYVVVRRFEEVLACFDARTGKPAKPFGEAPSWFYGPAGKTVVVTDPGQNPPYTARDLKTGKVLHGFGGFYARSRRIPEVAFSGDGRLVAMPYVQGSTRGDRRRYGINVWELRSGRLLRTVTYTSGLNAQANAMALDHAGTHLAAATHVDDGLVHVWRLSDGRELRQVRWKDSPNSLMLGPNAAYLATCDLSACEIWDLRTAAKTTDFHAANVKNLNGLFLSPDGKTAVTLAEYGRKTDLWDAATRGHRRALSPLASPARFEAEQLSRDRKLFAVARNDKDTARHTVQLWDLEHGKLLHVLHGPTLPIIVMAFSPDGKWLAAGTGNRPPLPTTEGATWVWNTGTGKSQHKSVSSSGPVGRLVFRPDSKALLAAEGWTHPIARILPTKTTLPAQSVLRLRDVASGKVLASYDWQIGSVDEIAYDPTGRYLCVGSTPAKDKHQTTLRDAGTGKEIRAFPGGSGARFSPDGATLCISTHDGKHALVLCDPATGATRRTIDGGYNAEYSPDGKRLLIAYEREKRVAVQETGAGTIVQNFEPDENAPWHLAFSPDGRYLATRSHIGSTRLRELSSGRTIATIPGFGVPTFFSDSVLAMPHDGRIRLFNTADGRKVGALNLLGAADWAVTTPDGRFDATEGGKPRIHFVRGMNIYELDQFFDEFYTPRLLARVLAQPAAETTADAADKLRRYPPPEVRFDAPKPGTVLTEAATEVKVLVRDTGGGIDEMKLLHNGKRVSGDRRGLKLKNTGKGKAFRRTYQVQLVAGTNVFAASAFSQGRIESAPARLEIVLKSAAKTAVSYILAVGINTYEAKKLTLNYARPDAESFVQALAEKNEKLFSDVRVTTLFDADATRPAVLAALEAVAAQATPADVFTLYYAGHGSVVDGMFYFVTAENVRLYAPEQLKKSAISIREMQKRIAAVPALKQLMVIDACQSGAATEMFAMRGAAEEKALYQLARSTGTHVLAATGSEQFAGEFEALGHGVFTYALLAGLKGGADGLPKDGKVTVYELKAYLEDQVPELTRKHKGEAQYPNTFSLGQDFPLLLR